jgi:acyl-CoA synthetase (NDP forming)
MKGFFAPQSIAVVGASSNPKKGGFDLISNLREKFTGKLYPINPGHEEVCGITNVRLIIE